MAWSIIQEAKALDETSPPSNSISATFTNNPAAGNAITVWIALEDDTTITISAVADGGDTFAAATPLLRSNGALAQAWLALNIPGGHKTVTANFSTTNGFRRLIIQEWHNDQGPIAHQDGSGAANGQSPGGSADDFYTSGNITTTKDSALVLAAAFDTDRLCTTVIFPWEPGTGYTLDLSVCALVANSLFSTEHLIQPTAATIAPTFTNGGGDSAITLAFALQQPPSPKIKQPPVPLPTPPDPNPRAQTQQKRRTAQVGAPPLPPRPPLDPKTQRQIATTTLQQIRPRPIPLAPVQPPPAQFTPQNTKPATTPRRRPDHPTQLPKIPIGEPPANTPTQKLQTRIPQPAPPPNPTQTKLLTIQENPPTAPPPNIQAALFARPRYDQPPQLPTPTPGQPPAPPQPPNLQAALFAASYQNNTQIQSLQNRPQTPTQPPAPYVECSIGFIPIPRTEGCRP